MKSFHLLGGTLPAVALIAAIGQPALGDDGKRPGQLVGCEPVLIDRLLDVIEKEMFSLPLGR